MIGGFSEVKPLLNQPSATIRRAIAAFFAQRQRDDLMLLYFSGHGVLDEQGKLYLAAEDTERSLLGGTGIEAAFITGEMDRSRSQKQVLILDCCHSGAFARGAKKATGATVGTAVVFGGAGAGRVVLTATDSTQYAWEGDQVIGEARGSLFTHFLIEGLRSGDADRNRDGMINIDELYDYAHERVRGATPSQTPGKWAFKQEGELIIARNPYADKRPGELAPELMQAVESPLAAVREGAVQELRRLLRGANRGLALAAQVALEQLAKDDSRRVSIAAIECLKDTRVPFGPGPLPVSPPSPVPNVRLWIVLLLAGLWIGLLVTNSAGNHVWRIRDQFSRPWALAGRGSLAPAGVIDELTTICIALGAMWAAIALIGLRVGALGRRCHVWREMLLGWIISPASLVIYLGLALTRVPGHTDGPAFPFPYYALIVNAAGYQVFVVLVGTFLAALSLWKAVRRRPRDVRG
jgi:hypothetical protein